MDGEFAPTQNKLLASFETMAPCGAEESKDADEASNYGLYGYGLYSYGRHGADESKGADKARMPTHILSIKSMRVPAQREDIRHGNEADVAIRMAAV